MFYARKYTEMGTHNALIFLFMILAIVKAKADKGIVHAETKYLFIKNV